MKKKYLIFSGIVLSGIILTSWTYLKYDTDKILSIFEERYSQVVLDDKNDILGAYLNKNEQWHLKSTDKIPEKLREAVLNYEDKNFYSHKGVDGKAIIRAARDNIFQRRRTGASTVTMQVAKVLEPKQRSYFNKYREIIHAVKIERKFTKDEILSMYLNNAPYGGNIVGYKTASLLYFQKNPDELTWAEGALLAVLPNSPGLMHVERNRARLINKRNALLKKLLERGVIDERQYTLSKMEPIPEKRYRFKSLAPHLTRRLTQESNEKIINSTINSQLQEKIEKIVRDYSEYLKGEGIGNAAVLVVDNKTYEVKVYVGSQNFYDFNTNGQVDGITAKRSPGSVLKPFLYALAIDEGIAAPESKIPDVPLYFSNFSPQNANKKYYGLIEMREALIKSLNIPFVSLLKEYKDDKFFYFLKEVLDFKDNNPSRYGLSLILGTKELSVENIAKLYTGLGNYGNFKDLKYTRDGQEEKGNQLISRGSAYLTLDTIRQLERPGLESMYREKNPVSWKTGTSYGRRDGWAAGVTPDWTVVVWVGNFTGESNSNLSGVVSAGKLLFNVFNALPKKTALFNLPEEDLEVIKVDKETGYRMKFDVPSKEILYPVGAKPLKLSPYYKKVFLNKDGEEIDSRNEDFSEKEEKVVLNYPIEIINYFIRQNMDVSNIFSSKIKEKSVKFIYPIKNLKIVIPKDFDGEKSVIVKVANVKKQNLYWYINKEYIGRDKDKEKSLNLKEGEYEITVVAENGETEKVKFEIVKNRAGRK